MAYIFSTTRLEWGIGRSEELDTEGSREGKVWHILRHHVNDETLDKGYAAATWKIDDVTTAYRYLRVRQTGKNEGGKDSLRLSSIELYGQLQLNE